MPNNHVRLDTDAEPTTAAIEVFTCIHCGEVYPISSGRHRYNGTDVCSRCFEDNYSICRNCGEVVPNEDINGNGYCSSCAEEETVTCNECGDDIPMSDSHEHNGDYYCRSCYDEVVNGAYWGLQNRFKYIPMEKEGLTKKYTFGLEIETSTVPDRKLAKKLREHPFSSTEDGSISGVEYVSDILTGVSGLNAVTNLLMSLKGGGQRVDKKCGLHLHIGGFDVNNYAFIGRLIATYKYVEPVLYAMLPRSRSASSWCAPVPLSDMEIKEIMCSEEENVLIRKYYGILRLTEEQKDSIKRHKYCQERYRGLNLHSLIYRGTIEIRYHSGTIDPVKIINWVKINLALFEHCEPKFDERASFDDRLAFVKRCLKRAWGDEEGLKIFKYVQERIAKFNPSLLDDIETQEYEEENKKEEAVCAG